MYLSHIPVFIVFWFWGYFYALLNSVLNFHQLRKLCFTIQVSLKVKPITNERYDIVVNFYASCDNYLIGKNSYILISLC